MAFLPRLLVFDPPRGPVIVRLAAVLIGAAALLPAFSAQAGRSTLDLPDGHRRERNLTRWETASQQVERLLKKRWCKAIRTDARSLESLFAALVIAPEMENTTRDRIEGGEFEAERVTFRPAPPPRQAAIVAAEFEAYFSALAIRTRCEADFDAFRLSRRPKRSAVASFHLRVAGFGRDGRSVLDAGDIEIGLRWTGRGKHRRWKIDRVLLHPRRRIIAQRVQFVDVTRKAGVPIRFPEPKVHFFSSVDSDDLDRGGLAVDDIDGDGDLDVYVGTAGPNLLLVNAGDGTFEERAAEFGVADGGNTRGVLIADFDGDGRKDIVVANRRSTLRGGGLVMYRNIGGRFERIADFAGDEHDPFTHLAAADIDGDGDLDIHVATHGVLETHYPGNMLYDRNARPDRLLINEGGMKFVDRAKEWGVADRGWSFASVLVDLDGDGRPELVVADDFGRKRVYRNDAGKRFIDVSKEVGLGEERGHGMGVTVADVDGDGRLDLIFANMYSSAGTRLAGAVQGLPGLHQIHERLVKATKGNTLWLSDGPFHFREASVEFGVAHGGWAWGVQVFDANANGALEVLSPCGQLTRDQEEDI